MYSFSIKNIEDNMGLFDGIWEEITNSDEFKEMEERLEALEHQSKQTHGLLIFLIILVIIMILIQLAPH